MQAITWGTTEEAAHAVASLENILSPGKQFAIAAEHVLQKLFFAIASHFQRDVLPRVIFLSGSNGFELFYLCCRSQSSFLRTSEGIRSRFVAAGIVQPLVSLLSDGSMDTRCKVAGFLMISCSNQILYFVGACT